MIDRGISENYVIWWIEAWCCTRDRVEQCFRVTRHLAEGRRSDRRSLIDIYDGALRSFSGDQILAAEFLRRVLIELANPSPVNDSLPPPDSKQWKVIADLQLLTLPRRESIEPAPRYRPRD